MFQVSALFDKYWYISI